MTSIHYSLERYYREMFIMNRLGGDGKVIDSFVVDKGHKFGAERHDITDNGLIVVYNVNSGILCTKLIARPRQIQRYYEGTGKQPPKYVIKKCREHQMCGYHNL